MKEFAFDIVLNAVVRVHANTESEARKKLERLDAVDLNRRFEDLQITEASLREDGEYGVVLFEIDGEPV